ncbi:hypothetical protein [Pseudoruegeria sp. HB172150]|uniref:hypothetical protein n=1 Tax=Pseudoruegeria sp. HB172150 TaxID=2721164 RepID=UPI001551F75B|nr:hypothetical protein [Pseudoruegeria sp. HB172150]
MRHLLIVGLALAPLPALADCPVAADLAGGVRLISTAGAAETFTLQNDGTIEVFFFYAPGMGSRYHLAKGTYLLDHENIVSGEIVENSTAVYKYPVSTEQLPDPAPGAVWEGQIAVHGDAPRASESQSYAFGETRELDIAGCAYVSLPVIATFRNTEISFQNVYEYLPELGFAYLASSGAIGQDPDYTVEIKLIEAVK